PSARSRDHAQGQCRLAHAPRYAGRPRSWQRDGTLLGRLEPPPEGIRQAASGLTPRIDAQQTNRRLAMKTHVVSKQEWEAAREQMLAKEKAMTRARDALAAERRRMPWMAVEK